MFRKEKPLNLIIIVIVAVVGGLYLTFYFRNNTKPTPSPSPTPPPAPYLGAKLEDMSASDLATAGFPAITVPGGVLTKSLKATSPEGKVQLTKVYNNPTSALDNFEYFKGLFSKKGSSWQILSKVNDLSSPSHKAIFASNSAGVLSINISSPPDRSSESIIELSFVFN